MTIVSNVQSVQQNKYLSPTATFLIIVGLLAVGFFLRVDSYFGNSISPFMSTSISLGHLGLEKGHIAPNPFEGSYWAGHADQFSVNRIFTAIILIELSQITDVDIQTLAYLPVVGIILPIVGYAIIKRLTNDNFVSLFYMAFLVVTPLLDRFFFEYQPLSYLYQFLLVYFVARFITDRNPKRALIPLSVLVIFASYQTYYTAELSNLMLLAFMTFSAFVFKGFLSTNTVRKLAYTRTTFLTLALVTLVIFLGIDTIVFQYSSINYPERISAGMTKFVERIGSPSELTQYTPTSTPLLTMADLVVRIILIACVVVPLLVFLINRKVPASIGVLVPLFVALLFYSIAEPIFYQGFTSDYVVSRNMILTLPIASFILIGELRASYPFRRKMKYLLPIIIMVTVVSLGGFKYFLTTQSDYQWESTRDMRDHAMISVGNIVNHLDQRYIMTTHELSSIVFIQTVTNDKTPDVAPVPFIETITILGESLENNNENPICSNTVSDILLPKTPDRPLRGEIWGGANTHLEPLGNDLYNMNNFRCYDKVYDDDLISLYTRINR